MKHSVNAKKAHSDLQMALDRMLKVLKNLNDSLHVVGLKGFPVSECTLLHVNFNNFAIILSEMHVVYHL